MKILSLTVTGDICPKGSNIPEDSHRISRLVTKVLWLGIDAHGVKERVSVWVFHRIPKMLTSVESTATLCLEASAVSNWLLDAQLLRLNLASCIMVLAVVNIQ